ncbi:MAG: DUF4197 family protein [Spirochaetes bacterium]|nr:DUF4197 family protein [Spirochaetota bacterium]MBN2770248.1 DUF4197 family protein [Spirochaetota bacterium]
MKKRVLTLFLVLLISGSGCDSSGSSSSTPADLAEGIRGALRWCAEQATGTLGKASGFLLDKVCKILLPESAQETLDYIKSSTAAKTALNAAIEIAFLGTDIDDIDSFEDAVIKSMNTAAEEAVADTETYQAFADVISSLSIDGTFDILRGTVPATSRAEGEEPVTETPYAATIYLKEMTHDPLLTAFSDIIDPLFDQKLGRAAYRNRAGVSFSLNELWGYYKTAVSTYNAGAGFLYDEVDVPADTIGTHVTQKALDGLFYKVGEFELKMRDDYATLFDIASDIYEAFKWADENAPDGLTDLIESGLDYLLP